MALALGGGEGGMVAASLTTSLRLMLLQLADMKALVSLMESLMESFIRLQKPVLNTLRNGT